MARVQHHTWALGWVAQPLGHGVPLHPPQDPHKDTSFTFRVLQAEAGLVALCHLGAIEVQEIVVGEHFHAVVVPGVGDRAGESVWGATAAC